MRDPLFGLDDVSPHNDYEELLLTTSDAGELLILQSILEGEKIPYRIVERGSGNALRIIAGAMATTPTDIFVPKAAHEQAQEILEAYRNSEPVPEEEGTDDIDSIPPEEEP